MMLFFILYVIPCIVYYFLMRLGIKYEYFDRGEVTLLFLILNFVPIMNIIMIGIGIFAGIEELSDNDSFSEILSYFYLPLKKEKPKKDLFKK